MRACIIGNGPSLKPEQLDLLKGELCYACNRIDLMYPRTSWRPEVYVRVEGADILYAAAWRESVKANLDLGIKCHMSGYFKDFAGGYSNYHEIKHCHHQMKTFMDIDLPDEWHMPQVCQFGGSLIAAMQIALNDGADELYLLGCDLKYERLRPSHFDPNYEHGYEWPNWIANRTLVWAHLCGINYHARRGLPYKVVNCTPGGDLHLYPRAKLEDVL
jgi:hypothetical protein